MYPMGQLQCDDRHPVDECASWYTNMYFPVQGTNWVSAHRSSKFVGCVSQPTVTSTPTDTPTPTVTQTRRRHRLALALGEECVSGPQCASTFCAPGGVCCNVPCTEPNQSYTLPGSVGLCRVQGVAAPAASQPGLIGLGVVLAALGVVSLRRTPPPGGESSDRRLEASNAR